MTTMKATINMTRRLFVSMIFLALFGVCHAGPTGFVRVDPESLEWKKESDAIVECYRQNLKPPPDSMIVPLFISVHLVLGEPVQESGASVYDAAFVYSEVIVEGGRKERAIRVFGRSPYRDRKWTWEPVLKIVETKDPLLGSCLLKEGSDLYKQISEYTKEVTAPNNSRDHTIALIVFEGAVTNLFGKNPDDASLLGLIFQPEAQSSKPVEK